MSDDNDPVKIDFDDIVRETERGICLSIDGKEIWLPKSQVEVDRRTRVATMPEWLANNMGLV